MSSLTLEHAKEKMIMETKRYQYPPSTQMVKLWSALPIVILFLALVFVLYKGPGYSTSLVSYLVGIVGLIIGQIMSLYMVYSYPDIWVSPEGIEVEFLWFRLPVRWNQIVNIVPGPKPFTPISRYWVVRVKGLTFFHRLYAFFATGSFAYSGFVIHEQMEECHALLADIRKAAHRANRPAPTGYGNNFLNSIIWFESPVYGALLL